MLARNLLRVARSLRPTVTAARGSHIPAVARRSLSIITRRAPLISTARQSTARSYGSSSSSSSSLNTAKKDGSLSSVSDAVEIIDHDAGRPNCGILLTCEHASNRLPAPYAWPESDLKRRLHEEHWAYDPGSDAITRELRSAINAVAVLSRYSRLLIDPNRPLTSDTLIRTVADNQPIALNADVSAHDNAARVERFYHPYHRALRAVLSARPATAYHTVLSLHSYTPNYEGSKRDVQIGVLYRTSDPNAEPPALTAALQSAWSSAGHDARFNEPWSGQHGFMYAADSLTAGTNGARTAVMVEFRNDLLQQPQWRATVVQQLVDVLRKQRLLSPITV